MVTKYVIHNESYQKNALDIVDRGIDKDAVQEISVQQSKRNTQIVHFLHKGLSEFIILCRMDIQNHTILQ